MEYLRSNQDSISKTEYEVIKKILIILNHTIHWYSKYRTYLFNFRIFRKYINKTKKLSDSSQTIVKINNEVIDSFRYKLEIYILEAFFAYTPFLRSEIILKILLFATTILLKIGLKQISNLRKNLLIVRKDFFNQLHPSWS